MIDNSVHVHGPKGYTSTYCQHGAHKMCGAKQRERGDMSPPHCKLCPAVCQCKECDHASQAAEAPLKRLHWRGCQLDNDHTGWCGVIGAC